MTRDVVLLHGFTHTGASWGRTVAALDERYLPTVPDIRGHGSAAQVTPVTVEAVIGDIVDLTPGAFTLVGYSMGGRIALHVALAYPKRIERLIVIGASPGLSNPEERRLRLAADERLAREMEALTIETFAERWARTPVLADQPPAVQAEVNVDRLRNSPAGLARALRGLGTGALPPLWQALEKMALPVTLVVGERDEKFTPIAEQMAKTLPSASVVVVRGAGHAVHLEAPEEVARIIVG